MLTESSATVTQLDPYTIADHANHRSLQLSLRLLRIRNRL
jgi:hypothetical protein